MILAAERRIAEPELNLLPTLTSRNMVSVDVGANRGSYTGALLSLSREVVAFEPNPAVAALIERSWPNAIVQICALGETSGRATLRMPTSERGIPETGWASITEHLVFECETSIEIEVKTLDSFALTNVGFIKIDVEGFEMPVLRGAIETIKRERPNLLIEAAEAHVATAPHDVVTFLDSLGYDASFWHEGHVRPFADWTPQTIGWHKAPVNNFIFRPRDD